MSELRFALRAFLRDPRFTAVALLPLALGIGVNAAVIGLVDAMLLRPLPGITADRLVWISAAERGQGGRTSVALSELEDIREGTGLFEEVAAFRNLSMNMGEGRNPERIAAQLVSHNYFQTLGVRAAAGRWFTAQEGSPGGSRAVAVVSHDFWRRLGGQESVLGRRLTLNATDFAIVGVAPKDFVGVTMAERAPQVWIPAGRAAIAALAEGDLLTSRHAPVFEALGRLRTGASIASATGRLRQLAQRLTAEHPDGRPLDSFSLTELRGLSHPSDRGDVTALGGVAFGISAIVLVIACANVAALLLGRATTRARDVGVRLALGAGRARIVRQLLTESLLLALGAGAAGLVLATWTTGALAAWLGMPFALHVSPDRMTMVGTLLLSAIAAVLSGLVPALHATRGSLAATLGAPGAAGGSRSRARLQRLSTISQIALSLALLATAGVLLRSVQAATRAAQADEQATRIISGSLDLAGQGYNTARQRALIAELLDRLRQLPGVESCSATAFGPGQGRMYTGVLVDGQSGDPARPSLVEVTWTLPGYFQAMGMPLVRGRDLGKDHVSGAAVVNEAFARKYWPGDDPIGKLLWMGPRTSPPRTVVGLVRAFGEGDASQRPALFVPRLELPEERLPWAVVVRTTGPAAPLAPILRQLVLQLDPGLPLFDVATLRQAQDQALAAKNAASAVLNIFGGLALLLASIGVYGLIGWQLARRRREIGVRMALGASRSDVLRMVVGEGGRLAAIGVGIGLALALAATRLMSGLVSGAAASDIPMLLAVSAVVGIVVCAASYLPARRITRVDPAEVLRAE